MNRGRNHRSRRQTSAPKAPPAPVILIVDDDEGLLCLLEQALGRQEWRVVTVRTGAAALEWLGQHRADLMLLDLKLADINAGDLITQLALAGRSLPFVIITGQGDDRIAVEMMKRGALDYLVKDLQFMTFVPVIVQRCLDRIARDKRLAEVEEQARLARSVAEEGYSARRKAEAALRTERDFNAAVLETIDSLVVVLDRQSRIVQFNRACRELTGYTSDEICGRPIWETLLLPEEAAGVRAVFEKLRAGDFPSRYENHFCTKAGGRRLISWSNTVLTDPDGTVRHIIGTGLDITERRRTNIRGHVQYEVTRVLAQVPTVAEALPALLESIVTAMNWAVGEFWEHDAEQVRAVHFWHVPCAKLERFVNRSRGLQLGRLDSLAGRVSDTVSPEWIPDLRQCPYFARRGDAAKAGLKSALVFPVILDARVLGAMVFLARQSSAPDKDLLHLFATLGSEIGQFIKRKRAEESLQHVEAHLTHAQRVAHVGSYELIPGDPRLHWSAETFRILGRDPAQGELSPHDYLSLVVHPDDQALVEERMRLATHEGARADIEYRIVRPDGSVRHVHSVAEPEWRPDGHISKIVGAFQDITEQKQLQKEILAIADREQARIGQDLHDGLCQHLAGIEFRLSHVKQQLADQSNSLVAETAALADLVRQAVDHTRTLAHGLAPVMLEPDGLMMALQELAATTEQTFRITTSLHCPAPVLLEDNAVAKHLYRIAQEAVYNAVRHGRAKTVLVKLLAEGDHITLTIKDDGVGFPAKPDTHNGMGLHVMQYRSRLVNGSLAVQRDPDGGTSVVCSLFSDGSAPKGKRA